MDRSKEDLIDNFVNITGVTNDRARFYLESSAWNLEVNFQAHYRDIILNILALPTNVLIMTRQIPFTNLWVG